MAILTKWGRIPRYLCRQSKYVAPLRSFRRGESFWRHFLASTYNMKQLTHLTHKVNYVKVPDKVRQFTISLAFS
jgi:hypothetical protein